MWEKIFSLENCRKLIFLLTHSAPPLNPSLSLRSYLLPRRCLSFFEISYHDQGFEFSLSLSLRNLLDLSSPLLKHSSPRSLTPLLKDNHLYPLNRHCWNPDNCHCWNPEEGGIISLFCSLLFRYLSKVLLVFVIASSDLLYPLNCWWVCCCLWYCLCLRNL